MKNNIKVHREKLKLTQQEVAKQLGMSVRAYQNYEQGKREPKLSLAQKIMEILHCDLSQIFPPL